MFTWKEMKTAMARMQSVGELPGFVCVAIDVEGQFDGSAIGHLGEFNEEELPRVCYDMRDFALVEAETEDEMKKKERKKLEAKADKKNDKRCKAFAEYMAKKFDKRFYKQADFRKKFLKNDWGRFYVRDFRVVSADDILDTKSKDGRNAEFKGMPALLITMGKGPKK